MNCLFGADRKIFDGINDRMFDYHGFYTVLLTRNGGDEDQHEQVRRILSDLWSLYIASANVLAIGEDKSTAQLYTFFPFGPDYCEQVIPVVQDRFVNNSFTMSTMTNLFPDKFRNFYDCPIRVATYDFEPYMILQTMPNGSYRTHGIDGIIFRVICQRLNIRPIVVVSGMNVVHQITFMNVTDALRPSLQMVRENRSNHTRIEEEASIS